MNREVGSVENNFKPSPPSLNVLFRFVIGLSLLCVISKLCFFVDSVNEKPVGRVLLAWLLVSIVLLSYGGKNQ